MAAANNDNINNFEYNWLEILEEDLPSESKSDNKFPICPDHTAVQNLFCTSCVQGVCFRCIIEAHNGHALDYYDIATARGLAVRDALSWEMEDAINELTVGRRRVYQVQNSMERKVEAAKDNIKDYIKKCHTALDKREKYLLRRLSLVHSEKRSLLEEQQEEIKEHLNALIKSYHKLHNHSCVGDPVKQAITNSEALRELTASRDIHLTPSTNDRIHFWSDPAMRLRIRHYLGILDTGGHLVRKQEEDGGYCSPEASDSDSN